MDNVKRLIANIMFGVAVMKEHEHGHYVLYDDYAAAEARAEQAEADCAVILKVLNELYSSILDAEQDWSGESNYINYSKQSLEMIVAEESLNMPHPGSALLAEMEQLRNKLKESDSNLGATCNTVNMYVTPYYELKSELATYKRALELACENINCEDCRLYESCLAGKNKQDCVWYFLAQAERGRE